MTGEEILTTEQAFETVSCLVGEYVWFSRCIHDGLLRMEFGEPHLTVHGPKKPSPQVSESVMLALHRRIVVPTGRWSLFVEDGLWSVEAGGLSCGRSDLDKKKVETCLGLLDGQKLTSIVVGNRTANLDIHFDLSGRLKVVDDPETDSNSQWMLFFDDKILSYNRDGNIVLENV